MKKLLIIVGSLLVIGFIAVHFMPAPQKENTVTYDQYGIPSTPVSYEFVRSQPEAKLFYPNGKVFQPFGSGQERNEFGWGTAFSGAVMTTTDPPEKVYAWYREWLLSHGWQAHAGVGLGGSQISGQDYTKNDPNWTTARETFSVAMDSPKLLGEVIGKRVPDTSTVFEFSYMIK